MVRQKRSRFARHRTPYYQIIGDSWGAGLQNRTHTHDLEPKLQSFAALAALDGGVGASGFDAFFHFVSVEEKGLDFGFGRNDHGCASGQRVVSDAWKAHSGGEFDGIYLWVFADRLD